MSSIEVSLINTEDQHAIVDLPPKVALFIATTIEDALSFSHNPSPEDELTEEEVGYAKDLLIQLRNQAGCDEDGNPW